jgi:hypothetical protein
VEENGTWNSNIGVAEDHVPVRQVSTATLAEAKAMDCEAVQIIRELKSGWLRLGFLIERMKETRAFAILGFGSMHSWMQARLGESLSSAYSALQSVRKLKAIPEEKLRLIGERNAHLLARLPDRDRVSAEWIEKATKLPIKDFQREVEIALEKKTGLTRERLRPFVILLPELVYDSLCEAEKKLAWTLGIDIETTPASRILVWEALSQWILQTDEQTIKVQTEGM